MKIRERLKLTKPENNFERNLEQELLSAWLELASLEENHIDDADGTLADLTLKFNTLLSQLEAIGILKRS